MLMPFQHRSHEEWFVAYDRVICVRPSVAFAAFGVLVVDVGSGSPEVYETAESVPDLVARVEERARVDF